MQTTTGGTVFYMSPEAIRGEQVDEQSDIYSLGATLYELASGLPPFTQGDIAYQHVHVPPQRPEGMSDDLWGILGGCLAKEAEDRPVDAREVGRLLASTGRKSEEDAGGGAVRAAGPVAQSRRGLRIRRYAPILVLLGCLAVASGWLWYQRVRGGPRTEAYKRGPCASGGNDGQRRSCCCRSGLQSLLITGSRERSRATCNGICSAVARQGF